MYTFQTELKNKQSLKKYTFYVNFHFDFLIMYQLFHQSL